MIAARRHLYRITDDHPPLNATEITARLRVIADQLEAAYIAITRTAPDALRMIRPDHPDMDGDADYMAATAANIAATTALQAAMARELIWEAQVDSVDLPGGAALCARIESVHHQIQTYYTRFAQTWRGYTGTDSDLLM